MCLRRLKKLRTPGFSVKVIDHQVQNTKHLTAPLLQISQILPYGEKFLKCHIQIEIAILYNASSYKTAVVDLRTCRERKEPHTKRATHSPTHHLKAKWKERSSEVIQMKTSPDYKPPRQHVFLPSSNFPQACLPCAHAIFRASISPNTASPILIFKKYVGDAVFSTHSFRVREWNSESVRESLTRGSDHNFMTASTDQLPSFDSENQIALVLFSLAVVHGHRELSSHMMHIPRDSGFQEAVRSWASVFNIYLLLLRRSTTNACLWKVEPSTCSIRHLDDLRSNRPLKDWELEYSTQTE
ncbi:hypothetical protein NA56DRAFT_745574 [Hyaloscypha hepaticicola]|uniref:Uncharacterized protein n=1 Tax=Hyaloscypha hepaticicola TaxID=2082293 RepID=A0A2J6QFD1_9HELO|nr:hypothetical protein NA56DRAFT_745574 [Hyaloscypha hepaticicola]